MKRIVALVIVLMAGPGFTLQPIMVEAAPFAGSFSPIGGGAPAYYTSFIPQETLPNPHQFPFAAAGHSSPLAPAAGTLLISEFRVRGGSGAADEFIEIYNNTGSPHVVAAVSGTGYSVAASDGVVRCTIPNGTVFPPFGHYLCVNSGGYSLSTYPAGSGTTATGNATYTTDIPDNVGIALFNNNSGGGSFTLGNRFDAVGAASEANALYKEGTGNPVLTATNSNYSFFRKLDPVTGFPVDTDNNAADFMFADTVAASIGAPQRLGAPGPQNLSSPVYANSSTIPALLLDATKAASVPPNRTRDFTSDPPNNSIFGTLSIRRRFVNNTGGNLTRLRFRVRDISTFPNVADLRLRSVGLVVVAAINDAATCSATGAPATPPCTVSVQGTTLETPAAQPNGGGFNSSMSAGTVTLATPLANGASINLQFLMGVQGNGTYHLAIEVETLPVGGGGLLLVTGDTFTGNTASDGPTRISDFDGDGKSDISIFRPGPGEWWYLKSSNGGNASAQFGSGTDTIVPGDLSGDRKSDFAVWRPSTGEWFVLRSEDFSFFSFPFGSNGDIPAPADYDGDGFTDTAVFRPSSSTWFITKTSGGVTIQEFGTPGDVPVPADYDGDGLADIAIYRPSLGQWWLQRSTAGVVVFQFGTGTDKTVQGDYTGDGKADVAFYRPSNGTWFILRSENNSFFSFPFGAPDDIAAPGDYDGDGKFDATIFRPSNTTWFVNRSTAGTLIQQFGVTGDRPVPNAYVR